MSTPRQDAVKGYIVCLLNDGVLRGSRSPGTIASKVIAEFSTDVWAAASELGTMAATNVGMKIEDVAHKYAKRGLAAIWAELQAQLQRK